jgi:8-oxo-dGTP pyrophosphatase MutT (NUDIX family)
MKKEMHTATLVYVLRGKDSVEEVLFAEKLKKVLVGRLNGFGGKLKPGETPEAAAIRELREEAGLKARIGDLEKMAVVDFYNQDADDFHVHVYLLRRFKGEARAKDGMKNATWRLTSRLPFEQLAPGDPFWLPKIFGGKKIIAEIWHGPKQETLTRDPVINIVETLP